MKANPRNRKKTQEELVLGNVFVFKCEICGSIRPDKDIAIHRIHTFYAWSDSFITRNVRYCADRFMCSEGVPFFERSYRKKILQADRAKGKEEPEFVIENEI